MTEPVEPEFGTLAFAMAKTTGTGVADAATGRVAGAVYKPVESMVPKVAFPLGAPFTLHCTALVEPEGVATNRKLVPSRTVAEAGETAMVTEELLLPHPAMTRPMTSARQSNPNRAFMLLSPMYVAFLARPGRARNSFRRSD